MSTYGGSIYGGYGFGWGYGPVVEKVDAPADPAAKAEANDPLERPDQWGYAAAQMGLPGFTKAPNGTDSLYWQMRKYSACVLAFAVTAGPIFAGTRTLEICREDGTPAVKRPNGPLAGDGPTEGPEDKIKADMVRHFDPLWPDILNGLEKLNFGRWDQEVPWGRKDNLTLPMEFRDFRPGEAGILYDAHGDFAGLRYNNQDLAPPYVLHHVHQKHLDRLRGYPRLENCRPEWWANHNTEEKLGRAETKAAGISLLIWFDREYKFKDNAGNAVSAVNVGQTVMNAMSTGGTALVPMHSFDKKTIEGKPELADKKPVEAEGFDWGQTAPAILACISVLDARDRRIMRAYGRPEREAMEGTHGTKAEAGVHGQIGVLDCEKVHAELVADFNRQTWRTTLLTNFGDKYVDRLYWKATPLADESKQFQQDAAKTMLATPGDPLPAMVDRKALLQKTELPYDESYVPQPALPTGPTPPGGGPGGGNGEQQPGANGNGQANGSGNAAWSSLLGLSAGGRWGDDAEGPFDYALSLNCGTGSGGFQPGNKCQKPGAAGTQDAAHVATEIEKVPPRIRGILREAVASSEGMTEGADKAAAENKIAEFRRIASEKGIDADAVIGHIREKLAPVVPINEPQPADTPSKLPAMFHGSPAQREELRPGSMMTVDPTWSAGYTTKINANGTEDFTGAVHQVTLAPKNPYYVTGTLHDAEGWMIKAANGIDPKRAEGSLQNAAAVVHERLGYDAVVARNNAGEPIGALTLVPVKPEGIHDPVEILKNSKGHVPSNLERALERHAKGGAKAQKLSASGDDDYALSLNCGTGAGGFSPGNTCSKGGRQYVVSRVTRAGMVMGRGTDESPDVPPVELGHASEFTPAETPLSEAPLPEFAAKVQAIADGLPGFGDNKVYVSTAFDAAHEADPSLTMDDFKAKLKAANTAQLLKLSRADIPLNPAEVARSEIELGHGATAHYLLVKSDMNRQQAVRMR